MKPLSRNRVAAAGRRLLSVRAWLEKRIAGAALDVFEEEPPVGSPLLQLDNVIATPHLGALTREAQTNVALQVAEQVLKALSGRAGYHSGKPSGADAGNSRGVGTLSTPDAVAR